MSVSVLATTVELSQGLGTMGTKNSNVVHTPPAAGSFVQPDNTNKNTGRTTSATQSFLTNNNRTR